MKRNGKIEIQVWADWGADSAPVKMGVLSSVLSRGKEIFSFTYDEAWLRSKKAYLLDPGLQLYSGPQYLSDQKANFGMFLDSSPDRWGRLLQKRREAVEARVDGRKENLLYESDFLLGVHDVHRSGGLRFKISDEGPFLSNDTQLATPPLTSLRELEAAAWAIENDSEELDAESEKWIRMLIAPGGSLGGARPKASVIDDAGSLWIAKFPSKEDRQDSGVWEFLVYQLALDAGVTMSPAKMAVFNGPQHTFLSQRFDRRPDGSRQHFASAMTFLNKNDGASANDGTSYLELAEFLMSSGARPNEDLEQLWRRIVFSIGVSNTDDHLRNHGFLLTEKGWILSPAFDLNPNPDGEGLKLNISENDNSQSFDLALDVAPYFRVEKKVGEKIISEVVTAVKQWPERAMKLKISRAEQLRMKRAFRLVE